jgi:hypothetical protein
MALKKEKQHVTRTRAALKYLGDEGHRRAQKRSEKVVKQRKEIICCLYIFIYFQTQQENNGTSGEVQEGEAVSIPDQQGA